MAWKKDEWMTRNSMWSEFWRPKGHATGGIGIWDEPEPYADTGEEGYTVVVRDSADEVVSEFSYIPTKAEAMKTAKDLMKELNTSRKFCNYIKKRGGFTGSSCRRR
jgi:hypothetical protein